jgi:alpha-tubulin suppressor-like RCC1 family protein
MVRDLRRGFASRVFTLTVLTLALIGCGDDPVAVPDPGPLRIAASPVANFTADPTTPTVQSVTTGDYHTCALTSTGAIRCWGNNYWGQNNAPEGVFATVSAGRGHACALTTGGSIVCWGGNAYGQLNVPQGSLAAAERFTCALRDDGVILCWGFSSHGQTSSPPGTFKQISSSLAHGCAIATDDSVKCWGFNDYGQANAPAGTYKQVSAGIHHSCAVATDGTIQCWGVDYGPPPPATYTAVSAGWKHTCALTTSGQVRCWGDNSFGQTNAPAGTFSKVAAGEYHTCAKTSAGGLQCWGNNYWSQNTVPGGSYADVSGGESFTCAVTTGGGLRCWGYPSAGQTNPPPSVFTQVSAGESVTCAVGNAGTARCWGYNASGQANAPRGIFTQVQVAFGHACALAPSGAMRCWGSNSNGQSTPPTETFTRVAVGERFTCGLKTDGSIQCWGFSSHGQTSAPAGTYTDISVLLAHGCGVSTSGGVKCWGFNDYGQANGPTTGTFTHVSAGVHSSCAVRGDRGIQCWGFDYGQLIAPLGSYQKVGAGWKHACGVTTLGTLSCWGSNEFGQTNVPAELQTPPAGSATPGDEVEVKPLDMSTGQASASVSLVFDNVVSAGQVTVTTSSSGPPAPGGFRLGDPPIYYDITPSSSLTFAGQVEVCIDYTGQTFSGGGTIQILHSHDGSAWAALPASRLDTSARIVCGLTESFSSFTVAQANLAPTARATASPAAGVTEGSEVAFDGSSSTDDDGAIVAYEWDWENDGVFDAVGTSRSHTFAQDGVYRVRLRVTDDQGSSHTTTIDVSVANVLPTVTVSGSLDPIAISGGTAQVSINTTFSDPGTLDLHVTTVNCGNNTTTTASPITCRYTTPGVYSVTATVTDDDGAQSAVFNYVVVYDAAGGFVTGGGWVDSPNGACAWSGCAVDGSTTGKASFGFVAKYQKGATVPSGDTEFQFKSGNLSFVSTAYQWLVVAGARAQYKGDGTINGQGQYGFLLTAIDGQAVGGGGVDKFRLKIWDRTDNDRVVYDNQLGVPDGADPTTSLGGGSIVLHVK